MEKKNAVYETGKRKRQVNIELLRIISMIMVISLHYVDKGSVATTLTEPMSLSSYAAWGLKALCIVSVNVYVLISGYFLVESHAKCSRLLYLVCQVVFYGIGVPVVLAALGLIDTSHISLYYLLNYGLPIQMNHYWFATAYVLMYLLVPVLNIAVKNMSKKQLQYVVGIMLLVFSVSKTVLVFDLTIDNLGYDMTWFICLYLVAAYIRLYGFPLGEKKPLLLYLGSVLMIYSITMVTAAIYRKLDVLGSYMSKPYNYNYFFCLTGAVGFFYIFWKLQIPEGRAARIICKIAPYTFGVYLLHENMEIRYLWITWLRTESVKDSLLFLPHYLVSVILVFAAGILVDMCRGWLFMKLGGMLSRTNLGKRVAGLDKILLGESRRQAEKSEA